MTHEIHKVTSFSVVAPYRLRVGFEDGLVNDIDFRPVLEGELFGPLQDIALFSQVQIDPEVYTLVWPNGADFDPATLHDWDRVGPLFTEMARNWAKTASH